MVYREQKKYDLALGHFDLAKKLQIELNDLYGLAFVHWNIGQVYFAKNRYQESLKVLETGLGYAEKADNLDLRHDLSNQLAATYEKLGDHEASA